MNIKQRMMWEDSDMLEWKNNIIFRHWLRETMINLGQQDTLLGMDLKVRRCEIATCSIT
jgi:hypothetical protein